MATRTRPESLWTDRPGDWLSAPDDARGATSPPPPPPRPPQDFRRSRRGPIAAGLAVLALAGGAYGAGTQFGAPDRDAPASAAALPAAKGQLSPSKINEIYARASKAVVSVQVGSGRGAASGTGFVIDREGTVVTNAHVVGSARQASVRFDDDGAPVGARVVGTDASTDLAVLRVDGDRPSVEPLALASSKDVRVGDGAIAIGYPLGLDRTATSGIVSGLEREIEAPNGFRIDEVIQTDAPINPGNSGGPLLDAAGRVIGVNSQIATSGGGNGSVGIGFAVPSDTVREVVPKLLTGQSIERPWLGVSSAPSEGRSGAQIATVTPGSPAARSGLETGDVITRVDGTAVADPDGLTSALEEHEPGDVVRLELVRDGREQTISITVGTRPERTP